MNETKTESVKTINGTASQVSRRNIVVDPYVFRQWMVKNPEVSTDCKWSNYTGEVAAYIADGNITWDYMVIDNILYFCT